MDVVCLDTMIIQWCVLKRVHDTEAEMLMERASDFMDWLNKQKCSVIIPSIVVGELLLPVDPIEHVDALSEFSTKWAVVDFDLRAARMFAQMCQDRAVKATIRQFKQGNHHVTRSHLKADMMILATARAYGADQFYSHNDRFIEIAKKYLSADNFLNVSVQMKLPETDE